MNKPETYLKFNYFAKRFGRSALDKYFKVLKFKPNETILDVGCGPGDVTTDILKPRFTENINKLIGVDISKEMVNFAKSQNKDAQIDFMEMDILTDKLPDSFVEKFGHVFSFLALNMVEEQSKAFKNIYNILTPGGEIFLLILASNDLCDPYTYLAQEPKWAEHFGTNTYVSPYHSSREPQNELKKNLEDVGFDVIVSDVNYDSYSFPDLNFCKQYMDSITPTGLNIPSDRRGEFVDDCLNVQRNLKRIVKNKDNVETLFVEYKIMVGIAKKPL